MIINRDLARVVAQAIRALPVIVITGARQTGKSTLLRHTECLKKFRSVSLDDMNALLGVKRDPEGTLAGREPLIIDEAQKAPEIFPAIKRAVDADRRRGMFVLSGSANLLLMRAVSESLAGRALYLYLGPLTQREIRAAPESPLLVDILKGPLTPDEIGNSGERVAGSTEAEWVAGGFPPAVLAPNAEERRLWFTGYEQTYLDRDLRDLTQVADISDFQRLMRLAALRTGQVLNLRDLARDAGINHVTASRWVSLLETSFLLARLPPWHSNRSKRLAKAPKIYWCDSGLASFMAGLYSADDLRQSALRGAIAETYLFQNLTSMLHEHLPEARVSHYRSHAGSEVDFIVELGRRSVALEMKASARVDPRDFRGLDEYLALAPDCVAGLVLYGGDRVVKLARRVWAVPHHLAL